MSRRRGPPTRSDGSPHGRPGSVHRSDIGGLPRTEGGPSVPSGALAVAALLAASSIAVSAAAQGTGPALTSAPYDLSLFRDGETRRMRARYGRWTVVCDEIIRLRSRYCSLSSAIEDADGREVARLDVSTDDAGRPAALLRLPHGTLLARPITLAGAGARPRALRATACDAAGCAAVWAPDAGDFAALKRGGLTLGYRRAARPDLSVAALTPAAVEAVAGLVPADGFAEAVGASMRAGPLAQAGTELDGLGLRR